MLAVTLGGFLAAAGAPAQPPSPTFPSKVELITVDVVVVDKKGQPVPGLTRDDFVVEAPTRIAADRDGRLVRLVGLDLKGLAEGAYEIVLDVHDEAGGATVERHEPFTIAP